MNRSLPNLALVLLLTLCGCAPAPQQSDSTPATAEQNIAVPEPVAAPAVDPFAIFNTSISVKELMATLINPNARQLWGGVSYVESADGVVEKMPQTQEDWEHLKANAIALIEGSNALMLPGRRMDMSDNAATADFQFTPEEIEQLVRDDPDNWIINLQTMQDAVGKTLEAINRKDIFGFTERGAAINESCEACHAQYWYKPLARQ